ncbi:hypothetical protein XFF6991_180332 [Xanthomonas phaseoli pv. phaseoli]|uniref:Uncharacterized protein n=1 Tax=Xanthomonas campestris pv. phaseoli TaxID=317013 RepID=A0A7Z7NH15_XANCH|nr:hypothetical protein XFF6991_180332 [Xanthomonas phaseoli pv. phaseoli]
MPSSNSDICAPRRLSSSAATTVNEAGRSKSSTPRTRAASTCTAGRRWIDVAAGGAGSAARTGDVAPVANRPQAAANKVSLDMHLVSLIRTVSALLRTERSMLRRPWAATMKWFGPAAVNDPEVPHSFVLQRVMPCPSLQTWNRFQATPSWA